MLTTLNQNLAYLAVAAVIGLLLLAPDPLLASSSLLKSADKQISAGKYKIAARTITKAMNSGDQSKAEMATALYKRGIAYNRAGRSGSAIADLTGAIWLGKLDSTSLKGAYGERARAYQATGHKTLARKDFARAGQNRPQAVRSVSNRTKPLAAPPAIPAFKTVVSKAKSEPVRKPAVPPKSTAIPPFRTSVVAE